MRRRFRWPRRPRRSDGVPTVLAASFIGGVVAGILVWSVQMRRWQRDLFSRNPLKRLAALGHLGGRSASDIEAVHLLNEYVVWEKEPALRRRAERLLQRRKRVFM